MKRIIITIIIIIFVNTLVLINLRGNVNAPAIDERNIREIVIDAKRFEYNPNVITIKYGEKIRFKINNLDDAQHGFSIPELGIEVHDEIEFVANKKGRFYFYCHHYCGSGHSSMKGEIIIE